MLLILLGSLACGNPATAPDPSGEAENQPPTVTVTSPAAGSTGMEGVAITFRATAQDPEDGDLSGSIAWHSSVDGAIGVGGEVTAVLSIGEHEVTASVTDSRGETSSAAVGISVLVDQSPDAGLLWPVSGRSGQDWVINNYVDLDPGPGLRDYTGNTGEAAKVYDGHRGVDIDVPNFRWMDDGTARVLAARAGQVLGTEDGQFDRNMSCTGDWNYVEVRHTDGSRAIYGHLKRGSVLVAVGDEVARGQQLGVVGSSGCSTAPHLHFELRNPQNAVLDPFLEGLWADPPEYAPPISIMDVALRSGAFSSVDEITDPAPNITTLSPGSVLGIAVSVAGGGPGDEIRVVVQDPDDFPRYDFSHVFDQVYRHSYWYWNRQLTNLAGVWTVTLRTNGQLHTTYSVTMQ